MAIVSRLAHWHDCCVVWISTWFMAQFCIYGTAVHIVAHDSGIITNSKCTHTHTYVYTLAHTLSACMLRRCPAPTSTNHVSPCVTAVALRIEASRVNCMPLALRSPLSCTIAHSLLCTAIPSTLLWASGSVFSFAHVCTFNLRVQCCDLANSTTAWTCFVWHEWFEDC